MSIYWVVVCPKCGYLQVTITTDQIRCLNEACAKQYRLTKAIRKGPYDTPREANNLIQIWKAKRFDNQNEYLSMLEEERKKLEKTPPPKEQKRKWTYRRHMYEILNSFEDQSFSEWELIQKMESEGIERGTEQFEKMWAVFDKLHLECGLIYASTQARYKLIKPLEFL